MKRTKVSAWVLPMNVKRHLWHKAVYVKVLLYTSQKYIQKGVCNQMERKMCYFPVMLMWFLPLPLIMLFQENNWNFLEEIKNRNLQII